MVFLLSFLIVAAAVLLRLNAARRDIRVVISATIPRSLSSVYDVISAVEMAPEWHRRPIWLPEPLRLARMVPWGSAAHGNRCAGSLPRGSEEISIRHIKNREFSYASTRLRDLSYESIFRLVPDQGRCRLTWEVRANIRRVPDIVGRHAIASALQSSMKESFRMVQHLVLSRPEPIRSRDLIYEARRGQIPAA